MAPPQNMLDLVQGVDALVPEHKFATLGDRIVIVAGAAMGTPGTLNGVILHTVGEQWTGELENSPTNGQTIGVQ
jgi:pyruvate kinase